MKDTVTISISRFKSLELKEEAYNKAKKSIYVKQSFGHYEHIDILEESQVVASLLKRIEELDKDISVYISRNINLENKLKNKWWKF